MTTNVAIVDERDPLIHYTGSWQDAGSSQEFNGTTRYSTTQGSTVSFTFVGTSIAVFGTVAKEPPPQASMEFVIDNSIQGTYTSPSNMTTDVHHQMLYTSPEMSNGTHTLLITQTVAQAAPVIYLDYIMYDTTSTDVGQYMIDDRDPRIQYDPPWEPFGSDPDFQHTSQASPSTGASFTLQFDGRGISYYGAINNGSAGQVMNASMVIDGGPPVFFVPPIQSAPVTTNNLIFNSGDLPSGNHTLVVTAENDHSVWVDYFLVTPPVESISTSAPSSISASAPSSIPTSSSISTSAPSSSASGRGTTSSSTVLIAVFVGGLFLLALLGVGLFFLHQRRRRRRKLIPTTRELLDGAAPATVIAPFSGPVSPRASAAAARTPFIPSTSHDYSEVSATSSSNLSNVAAEGGYAPAHAPVITSRKLANEVRYVHHSSSDTRSTDAATVYSGDTLPIYTV